MQLNAEYQAVQSFEEQSRGTPAQPNLEIASADAAFEQAKEERCWMEYRELVWADKHVEMTKEKVRGSLQQLRPLVSSLHKSAASVADSSGEPQFRYLIRELTHFIRPQCQLVASAENTRVMSAARHEVASFRKGLDGTPFADQFDLAQEDVGYEMSVTEVECAVPSRVDPAKFSRSAVADVRGQLAAIGRLIGNGQTRW